MSLPAQRPMAVHLVLQDNAAPDDQTRLLATQIYTRLARGSRPTSIPVHIWGGTVHAGVLEPPAQPPLSTTRRNAIILLIDQAFFDTRKQWKPYLDALVGSRVTDRDLLLPVSICGDAHRVATALSDINCVQVGDPNLIVSDERIFQAIFTAILRLLPETRPQQFATPLTPSQMAATISAPPQVFLCHTKSDGEMLAHNLRQYVYEQTQLSCFFDTHDIPHGEGVRSFITSSISSSCLLVIWTDRLLESRWCQFEILEARRQQRPLLVLDALSNQSPRIFPFLGNIPVVRWRENPAQILSALLLELVRARHLRTLFEALRGSQTNGPDFMLYPPDIMEASSVLRRRDEATNRVASVGGPVVYPDPPLPAEELAFLHETFPTLHLHSISEWTALRAANALIGRSGILPEARQEPLAGLSIGLSISQSEAWKSLGLISEHQDDFAEDMARELILLGARLLWGGDLRPEGLGSRLESLVRAYHQATHAPQDHVSCMLAWPNHRNVSAKDLQIRKAFAEVVCLPRPALDVSESDSDALDAICFSLMRQEMTGQNQARIILGGRLTGYRGRYPGLAEEALETINSESPLYIVGGFGGAARAVYEAIALPDSAMSLSAAWKERCRSQHIVEANSTYNELARRLKIDLRVDHDEMLRSFKRLGADEYSRRNRLSLAENERLASSQDIHEILALLVKGLTQLPKRPK
jgi:SLOG cluster2/TIR domain